MDQRPQINLTRFLEIHTAGAEFSFYVGVVFNGKDDGYNCGSVLFDSDAGLGLNIGLGLGICFTNENPVYIEFTIGGGLGAEIGFNICGVITNPQVNDECPDGGCGALPQFP